MLTSLHRRALAPLAVVLALGVALAMPGIVSAVEKAPLAPEGSMDVQVWPGAEPGRNVMVVGLELPEDTVLPARVRVPIPPDCTVVWAGEILGGDPAKDPKRDYEVVNGVGGTLAEFTLEKGRRAQLEALGGPLTSEGQNVSVAARWTQSAPARTTFFAVRLPAGSKNVKIQPASTGAPQTNPQGESLYSLPPLKLKPGKSTTVTASWTEVPVVSGAGEATPNPNNPVPLLLGLLAAAVVLLVAVLFWQRSRVVPEEPVDGPPPGKETAKRGAGADRAKRIERDSRPDDRAEQSGRATEESDSAFSFEDE